MLYFINIKLVIQTPYFTRSQFHRILVSILNTDGLDEEAEEVSVLLDRL